MAEQDLTAQPPALTGQPKAFTVPPAPELAAVRGQMGGLPTVPDYGAKRKEFKTSADVSTEMARQLQQENVLGQEIGMAEQAQKEYLAGAKAGIATQAREASQRIESDLDAVRARFPYPEFHPTQDNIQSLAGLFSIIGLIGTAMGGAGKNSALLALNSMSGMMKGWRAGRADLFKREKEEFDKNMQRVKSVLEDAYKDADRAEKMLAYNRQEAEALAAQSAAKLGGQIGKQILEKQSVGNYVKYLKELLQDFKHTEDRTSRERQAKETREAAERRHREAMDQRERLARMRAEEKGVKPPAKELLAQNTLRNNLIPKIQDALPVLDRLNEENKWNTLTTLLAVDPRLAETQFKNDPEALNLILTLAYFRSKEFETAGKALTRKEDQILAPIVRGDLRVYEGVKNAMQVGLSTLQKEQKALEAAVPYIKELNKVIRGEAEEGAAPAGPAAPAAATEPTATLNGRAIVVRGGKWVYKDTGEEAK